MQQLHSTRRSSLRERQEALEAVGLAPQAARSVDSRGREVPVEPCPLRTAFQRDRDRILHSKAFRRLKHKTQVFIAPEGDHYRTRLTHTLEVTQIARTIARALNLNEDLTEAIALGHDVGHTPFGHAGEAVLDELLPDGFRHNEQSVRVVETLEPLNLTWEVRDGILHHTGIGTAATLEGQIVKIADRVAYLNHDIEDAMRAGILTESDLPGFVATVFGASKGERIETMVLDLVETTASDMASVRMSPEVHEAFLELRAFMFKRVYLDSAAKVEERKVKGIIEGLYAHYTAHPEALEAETGHASLAAALPQAAADYIAGMTDRYALQTYEQLFLPRPWRRKDEGR